MEKALILESRLQVREMVMQAREAVDNKTPEVMEIDAKPIEEEINRILRINLQIDLKQIVYVINVVVMATMEKNVQQRIKIWKNLQTE